MRYQDHAVAIFPLEIGEQILDLLSRDCIEGRRNFVEYQDPGITGEGHCDENPLSHSPGELVGVCVHPDRVKPDRCKEVSASRLCIALLHLRVLQ